MNADNMGLHWKKCQGKSGCDGHSRDSFHREHVGLKAHLSRILFANSLTYRSGTRLISTVGVLDIGFHRGTPAHYSAHFRPDWGNWGSIRTSNAQQRRSSTVSSRAGHADDPFGKCRSKPPQNSSHAVCGFSDIRFGWRHALLATMCGGPGMPRRCEGRLALVGGCTTVLDDYGELPVETEPKLLRVLQKRESDPVGSAETRKVNARDAWAAGARTLFLTQRGCPPIVKHRNCARGIPFLGL